MKTSGQGSASVLDQRHAQRLRRRVKQSGLRGDVLERAVAAIAEEPGGRAAIRFRRAIRLLLAVHAAMDVGLGRPAHVVADEQIQPAIAVVVEPQGRGAEAGAIAKACPRGDVHEGALAAVAKQAVLANRRDQQILPAVVVEVRDGHAHPVKVRREARALGDIDECARSRISIELGAAGRGWLARPVRAVDEEQVLLPVVVEVEERRAGAQRLGEVLLSERAVVVREVHASRACDVGEADGRAPGRQGPAEAGRQSRRRGGSR